MTTFARLSREPSFPSFSSSCLRLAAAESFFEGPGIAAVFATFEFYASLDVISLRKSEELTEILKRVSSSVSTGADPRRRDVKVIGNGVMKSLARWYFQKQEFVILFLLCKHQWMSVYPGDGILSDDVNVQLGLSWVTKSLVYKYFPITYPVVTLFPAKTLW